MEVYVCDRFHVIVFFKGEKGVFSKTPRIYKEKKSSFTSKMSVSI